MTPQTRYARSGELSIAYQVVGDGPIDLVLVPDVDLSIWRKLPAVLGVSVLIYGLVTDS